MARPALGLAAARYGPVGVWWVFMIAAVALTVLLRRTALPSVDSAAPADGPAFSARAARDHTLAIARTEHPIGSDANWEARKSILKAFSSLADSASGKERKVEVIDASGIIAFNATANDASIGARYTTGSGLIIQDSNVYFRIPGTNERERGDRSVLLLSAHFDSVATALGTGDDAMGVGTLLEVARAVLARPPLSYSLLFNINNGEEFDLIGAKALIRNATLWRDVAAFINVDSVCPTGRSILYRSTSRELVQLFKEYAPFPHASVLGQEAMNAGLIQSDTDYSAYRRNNVTGVDFAFYDNRWVYHSNRDTDALMSDTSLAHLGGNILGLLDGIQSRGIEYVRRRPEVSNVLYNDLVGRHMWVVSYPGMGITALVTLVVAAIARVVYVRFLARGAGFSLSRKAISAVKATLVVFLVFLVMFAGSIGITTAVLAVQPMAVSGNPWVVLALTAAVGLWIAALLVWFVDARRGRTAGSAPGFLRGGVIGFWSVFLVLIAATALGMSTAILAHVYWYAVCYLAVALVVEVGFRRIVGPALNVETKAASTSTSSTELPLTTPTASTTAKTTLSTSTWATLAEFSLASVWPLLVSTDLAFTWTNTLAPTVQETTAGWMVALVMALFTFPVAINAVPLLSALSRNGGARVMPALLTLVVVGLAAAAMLLFPFNATRPVNVFTRAYARANVTASGDAFKQPGASPDRVTLTPVLSSGTTGSPAALVPQVVAMPDNLGGRTVDELLGLPARSCAGSSSECTVAWPAIGYKDGDVAWPGTNFTLTSAAADGAAFGLNLALPPGTSLTCTFPSALKEPATATFGGAMVAFNTSLVYTCGDPSVPAASEVQMQIPRAALAGRSATDPLRMSCRVFHGRSAAASGPGPAEVWRALKARVPEYVALSGPSVGWGSVVYSVALSE
ncbi:hypothetical protein H9P43_003325 [Blastocladiella emersonii ATCC 22665]|nr:hypothetical protein H9P43_003325 [Blastocladiella emersonii ATCC 22665]